jgi:hypothetical protein
MEENVNEMDNADTAPESETPSDFAIPEAYQNAGWASNIHSVNDLWEQHANAQKLIGKKTIGIPTADSSEQEVADYYAKLRPTEAKDYSIDVGEDTDFFKEVFFENGLTDRQAKAISEAYQNGVKQATAELYSAEGMDKAFKDALGENYKDKMDTVTKLFKQYAKPSVLEKVDKLPNEELALLYGLANTIIDKYSAKELGATSNEKSDKPSLDLEGYYKEKMELDKRPHNLEEEKELKRKYGVGINV